jgi:ribosomal protein S27AE
MSLQSATPAVLAFARYFSRPRCPRCGDEQFVPEHSEYAGKGVTRHTWSCESCGNPFRTTVKLQAAAAA